MRKICSFWQFGWPLWPWPWSNDQGHIMRMLQYPIPIYFDIFVLIWLIEGGKRLVKLGIFAFYIKITFNYRVFCSHLVKNQFLQRFPWRLTCRPWRMNFIRNWVSCIIHVIFFHSQSGLAGCAWSGHAPPSPLWFVGWVHARTLSRISRSRPLFVLRINWMFTPD